MKIKTILLLFFVLYFILYIRHEITTKSPEKIIVADKKLIQSEFKGEVISLYLGRGFEIEIKNYKNFVYVPSNYCNSSTCLAGFLEIGDTLIKYKNSDTIYQIKKSNNKKYIWFLIK